MKQHQEPRSISGIYPHLAVTNHSQECGIGAIAAWADRLWIITYPPHAPQGSEDKLYEIDARLRRTVRPESVGGTHACRMVHRESGQLIIGPYLIDAKRNVRVIPPDRMPGRLAAVTRHLLDPARLVLFYDMEGAVYEADVRTGAVRRLFFRPAAGWHGKGAWTGGNRFIVSNNGEQAAFRFDPSRYLAGGPALGPEDAGSLAEWDGRTWRIVYRRQFTEVTGPGGIEGARNAAEPVWALGWDRRSVLLAVLYDGKWRHFRLPKASCTYDGVHGWYTEWPRIRAVSTDRTLATMHGTLWDFPRSFRPGATAGLRPIGSYLKMIVDFCRWGEHIVFACNDASLFDNPLCGQAQSNLWFVSVKRPFPMGPPSGSGGPWLWDDVPAGLCSAPFLFAGYERRRMAIVHETGQPVTIRIEHDRDGRGKWKELDRITVAPRRCVFREFPAPTPGEWLRFKTEQAARSLTIWLTYEGPDTRPTDPDTMFEGLATAGSPVPYTAGWIRPRGADLGTLHFASWQILPAGAAEELGYYELTPDLVLRRKHDPEAHAWLKAKAAPDSFDFEVDAASVVVKDAAGIRRRLPKGVAAFDRPTPIGPPRGIREVVTERSLFNAHGTIYELPRPSAGGMARMRPVCTHNLRIHDFCSWRGLLVLCGLRTNAIPTGHVVVSDDGKTALWLGAVDDLWRLGRPAGRGGPWHDTAVEAGRASDPFLVYGFGFRSVRLWHDAPRPVRFTMEVDLAGDDRWSVAATWTVPPDTAVRHPLPSGFHGWWVRFRADRTCRCGATLTAD